MIYTGKSKDGSDIKESQGVFLTPDGKTWYNYMPYIAKNKDEWRLLNRRKKGEKQ